MDYYSLTDWMDGRLSWPGWLTHSGQFRPTQPETTIVPFLMVCLELYFCSDSLMRVNLGLLKPLWHLYLSLVKKHGLSDSSLKPTLLVALTELFLAVETTAEV